MSVSFDPVVLAAAAAAAVGPITAVTGPTQDVLMHGTTTSALGVVALVLYKLATAITQHLAAVEAHRAREVEQWRAQETQRETERDYWRVRREALPTR